MVLGFLLYETVDLGVNLIRVTYNGARATYYWWYDMDYPEVLEKQEYENELSELKQKVAKLEKIIEEKNH
jgi:hypothetical protein